MSLGALHYNLLLLASGLVLLMQTAVKSHFHQPDSYHDARNSLHIPLLSLSLDKAVCFAEACPDISLLLHFAIVVMPANIIPICTNLSARQDPSPSRAPPGQLITCQL